MSRSDLKRWPVFNQLEPDFLAQIHMVVVYGKRGKEALIVTKDDMVYGLGSNSEGCLGTGDAQSTLHPKKVEVLCQKGVKTFAYGSGPHVLALTNSGEVYSWGYNGYSELGNGKSDRSLIPSIVCLHPGGKVVVDIACGSHHSLALTEEGEVFAWGKNTHVALGIWSPPNCRFVVEKPTKVNSALVGKKIVSIVCGEDFNMAVTDVGEVYSWGSDDEGQLGVANNILGSPSKVTALDTIIIVKVVCGSAHTLALSDEGVLYVWGRNHYGQLGLGNVKSAATPVKVAVDEMGRVYDIAAVHYNNISVAMGQENRVYVWGQCGGQSITSPLHTCLSHLHDALAFYANPSVMHQPLVLHAEQETSVLGCLKNAFDDASTGDLIIQAQGKPIHVHKSVLKIRCQHFRSMFQQHWAEDSQNILKLDQFSHEVYKSFLRYLYTDDVVLPVENTFELLDLAQSYCESQLQIRCVQLIKHGITVENAALLYITAIQYNAKELEEFCFKFALNHFTAFVQTTNFANLDESTRNIFVTKAAQAGLFKT